MTDPLLTPVRIPTTPDGVTTALGHPDSEPAKPVTPTLRDVLDDALATAPVDHWVTTSAADELITHIEKALIDASGGGHHIVSVKGYGWTVQHPITERFDGTLFDCPMTALIAEAPFEEDGQFTVWIDRAALRWEPVTS